MSRPFPPIRTGTVLLVVVILVVSILFVGLWLSSHATPPTSGPSPSVSVADLSKGLGSVFHPGIILGGAANATTALLAGIGVYLKARDVTLPVLARAVPSSTGLFAANLTSRVYPYFADGGTYGLAWNGSAWLVTGQASWDGKTNDGTAVFLQGDSVVNITGLVASYFHGGGIWTAGWNGSAWLLAGNSSSHPTLVALNGTHVTDLSALIPASTFYAPSRAFIQVAGWNGAEWMLGGSGIFGILRGHQFVNLMPPSPYVSNGVYSVAWNGSVWLVGGGAARVSVVTGDTLTPGPSLPSLFNQVVLFLGPAGAGWVIGGKASTSMGGLAPGLAYWAGASNPKDIVDLSSQLPNSFGDGEIQGGLRAPGASGSFLLVGQGQYNFTTGYGVGAVAEVTIVGTPVTATSTFSVWGGDLPFPPALAGALLARERPS